MQHKFLKLAGVKTEKEFYAKFPTEEAFFKAHPEAHPSFAKGGTVPSKDVNTGEFLNTRLGEGNSGQIVPLPNGDPQPGPKPRKPIVVTSPNDPRLKAYNDSLSLYQGSNQARINNLLKQGFAYDTDGNIQKNNILSTKDKEQFQKNLGVNKNKGLQKIVQDGNDGKKDRFYGGDEDIKAQYEVMHGKIAPVATAPLYDSLWRKHKYLYDSPAGTLGGREYDKGQKGFRKNPNYGKSNPKDKTGEVIRNFFNVPIYKEPVQPVVYQKPQDKPAYKDFLKTVNPDYLGNDYDLETAYNKLPYNVLKAWAANPEKNHLPDTYKLPNHPTFSNESIYYKKGMPAVKWEGNTPVPINQKPQPIQAVNKFTSTPKSFVGKDGTKRNLDVKLQHVEEIPEKIFPAPVAGQSKPARITAPQQSVMPEPQGDYVYGPANSVIGTNVNGKFTPINMPEQRGKVNQADWDMLNNQESMKKYVQGKGLKMGKGGKVSASKALEILHDGTVHGHPITEKQRKFFGAMSNKKGEYGMSLEDPTKPILPQGDPRFSTASNVDIWGNAAPLNGAVKPPTYASTFPSPSMQIPGGGNPAWENYPGLGASAKIPTNPNAPKMLPNPDYIQNTGEGQLNMGKNPNKTPGQNKYDPEAVKTGGPSANKNFQMPEGKGAEGSGGQALLAGLMAFDALMPKEKIRRRYLRPEDLPSYNPNQYGTGSQAINKNGGKIKGEKAFWGAIIGAVAGKASNKADTDKKNLFNNVQESLAPLMGISQQSQQEADRLNNLYLQGGIQNTANLQTIPPPQYYMYGGKMKYKHGGDLQTHDGGNTSLASYNPFDGGTFQFNGDSHEKGGIDISYKGNPAEVEGGETAFKDQKGDLKIMGNLKVPGTNMKYKAFSKKLADKEEKAQKYIDKGSILLNTASPEDPYELLAFNSGRAMTIGGLMKQKELADMKEHLGNMQEAHLELAKEKKMSPDKMFKDGGTMYAEDGATLASEGDPIKELEEQKEYFKEILKNPKKYYKWEVDQAKEFEKNPFNFYKNLVQYQKDAIKGGAKDSFWKEDLDKYNEVLDYLKNPKKYTTKIPTVNSTGDVATSKPETINNSTAVPSSSTGDPMYEAMLKKAAEKYGVSYETIKRMVDLESGFVPGRESKIIKKGKQVQGTMGIMQMMEGTAKEYGLTKKELMSKAPEDIEKQIDAGVRYYASLKKQFNNSEPLATYAYNMGPGNMMKFIKASGKKLEDYTAEDLDKRMEWKRANQPTKDPNAAQNQTYDYKKNTFATVMSPEVFRNQYYNQTPQPTDGMFNGSFKVPDFNYTPKATDIQTVQGAEGDFNLQQPAPYNKPSNARGINPLQFLGEGYAMATNQEEPVKAQLYNPELFQPYQVSFQDRLNENNAVYKGIEKQLAYDPTALSTLAGQKYSANSSVLAEEFRTNQQIANDITNKNVSLLNEAKKTNLSILDTQYVRQETAKSKTRDITQAALNSISSKMLQKEASNNMLKVYENLYPDYAFNKRTGKAEYYGPAAEEQIDWSRIQPSGNQPSRSKVETKTGNTKTTQYYDNPTEEFMKSLKLQEKKMNMFPKSLNYYWKNSQ